MTTTDPRPAATPSHAERCRTLAAAARTATLSTLAHGGTDVVGAPYGSLVAVACDGAGRPVLLLSSLAEHTQNLAASTRASILVAEPCEPSADALALGRMTLIGTCEKVAQPELAEARALYLEAHPRASTYVDFHDFAFWRLEPGALRYVGGFGRMSWVDADAYRRAEPDPLAAASAGILAHMNDDHADAVLAYAKALAGIGGATAATMTAVDRYGFELRAETPEGAKAARLAFDAEVTTTDAVRKALVALVKIARAKG